MTEREVIDMPSLIENKTTTLNIAWSEERDKFVLVATHVTGDVDELGVGDNWTEALMTAVARLKDMQDRINAPA